MCRAVAAVTATACLIGACDTDANARTWEVGKGRQFANPSAVAPHLAAGDTVLIDAGAYEDCVIWRTPRISIRAAGGAVEVRERTCDGKALWVVAARDMEIDGITFVGAKVPDRNGAGIRMEPDASLTVRNSVFRHNEIGVLTANGEDSYLRVSDSTFDGNGPSHGLYANFIGKLQVSRSVFRNQAHKHHIKSRAAVTEIADCTIEDGELGTSSYLIELPNGGAGMIERNRLHKGIRSENRAVAIAIGLETPHHSADRIAIRFNQFVSDTRQPVTFVRNQSPSQVELRANRLSGGQVVPLSGAGRVID